MKSVRTRSLLLLSLATLVAACAEKAPEPPVRENRQAATVGRDEDYVVLARYGVAIGRNATIESGDVGVIHGRDAYPAADASCKQPRPNEWIPAYFDYFGCYPDYWPVALELGNGSTFAPGVRFVADTVVVEPGQAVDDVHYARYLGGWEEPPALATNVHQVPTSTFPLVRRLPTIAPAQPSGDDQGLDGDADHLWFNDPGTYCLPPGEYGDVTVGGDGIELVFAADCEHPEVPATGTYSLRDLRAWGHSVVRTQPGIYRMRQMFVAAEAVVRTGPGEYHIQDIVPLNRGRIVFGAGQYHVRNFLWLYEAKMAFDMPQGRADFFIANRVWSQHTFTFNATTDDWTTPSTVDPSRVRVYVLGHDGPSAMDLPDTESDPTAFPPTPYAFDAGWNSIIRANVWALGDGQGPGGTISVPGGNVVEGGLYGDFVRTGDITLRFAGGMLGTSSGDASYLDGDLDDDGIADAVDLCLTTPNPDQADVDADGLGDACDNCPSVPNPKQERAFPSSLDDRTGAACADPVRSYCGDGVVDPANGEQCDDGFANNGDGHACSGLCAALAPVLVGQPLDATVVEGGRAVFGVTATGSSLVYQWQRNGVLIPGATSAELVVDPVTLADDGASFRCHVAGAGGVVTSASAVLHVTPSGPAITTHPADATAVEGATATFSVTATGAGLAYQWQKDGVAIPGASQATYSTPAVALADEGSTYRVVITNVSGSVTSSAATLHVSLAPPTITTNPTSMAVDEGADAAFTVVAAGSQLAYQWQRNGVAIAGATSATLTVPSVAYADAGALFRCVVTNPAGSVTSTAATLSVHLLAPTIASAPTSQTVQEGGAATFAVIASGSQLAYQWQRDGAPIAGATSAALLVDPVTVDDDGARFRVVVTNASGSVTSAEATLNVSANAPVVASDPSDQTVDEGSAATFAVAAVGTRLSYQWQKNGVAIAGARSATLVLASVAYADDGTTYRCVVTNSAGSATSAAATLHVRLAAPTIATQPADVTADEDASATFAVVANGTNLAYAWQRDGVAIPGANQASYVLPSASADLDGSTYRVVVSNAAGSVTSAAATLTVALRAPVIASAPSDVTLVEGGAATFSVTATGSRLGYQWQRNGVAIPGATAPAYTTDVLALSDDEAQYRVVVTNPAGSVTSAAARVHVTAALPLLGASPVTTTVVEGTSARFEVTASGSLLAYQWQRDGVDIPGATGTSYVLDPVRYDDHGSSYRVVVTNPAGSVTSPAAVLHVTLALPTITTSPADREVLEGGSTTFAVAATGTLLHYQWFRNGVPVAEGTGPTLELAEVRLSTDGDVYSCIVTNASGSVTSASATLHVRMAPPTIETSPVGLGVDEGAQATFTVVAHGSQLAYAWERDGVAIPGANGPSLVLPAASIDDDGARITAVVSNAAGSVTSAAAVLHVTLLAPVIVAEPGDAVAPENGSATFGITVRGSRLSYQWYRGGMPVAGATGASLTLDSLTLADSGTEVRVVVSNAAGSVTSALAHVTVSQLAPLVTTAPLDQAAPEHGSATFACAASGTGLSYQWLRDGVAIAGATASSYTVSGLSLADEGARFACVVTNGAGSVTSAAATLHVQLVAPTIGTAPAALSLVEGRDASFTVEAQGSLVAYQWRRDGVDLVGATGPSLVLANVAFEDDGAMISVVVSNGAGSVESTPVRLTVAIAPPVIDLSPVDVSVSEGATAAFHVTAHGRGLSYQWERNGEALAGATSADFVTAALALADDLAAYRVVVSNAAGSVTSATARVHVGMVPPTIAAQPADVSVDERTSTAFVVAATGSQLAYQWRRDGLPIAGATSARLELANVALADDGAVFTCVVSNAAGQVTSAQATLGVRLVAPIVEEAPVAVTVEENADATFTVRVLGSLVSYEWLENGVAIPGANTASLVLPGVAYATSGRTYAVRVSNAAGTLTTTAVALTVQAVLPVIVAQPAAQTVGEGGGATFSVAANGSALAYQWRKNGSDVVGATSETLVLANVPFADDGATYSVVVTNPRGSVTSQGAVLHVTRSAPTITSSPSSVSVLEGETATFTVEASGTGLSYAWRKDGEPIAGASGPSYSLAGTYTDDGSVFTCVVTNSAGSVTSGPATLTVRLRPPTITTSPSDVAVQEGAPATFTVAAQGTAITYQWRRDGQAIAGANGASYTLASTTAEDDGARFGVVVGNGAGSVTSTAATLTISAFRPRITSSPSSVTVDQGEVATFTVAATGGSLAYQWTRDGQPIGGATGPSYAFTPALSDDGAVFAVVVSNAVGSVTSATASLHVVDGTAPTLVVDGSTDRVAVDPTIVLTGTASDAGSGLASVSVRSSRYGTPFAALVDGAGAFQVEVPLAEGTNVLTVAARDAQGNEATRQVTVTLGLPSVPRLAITSPSANAHTTEATIAVAGTVESSLAAADIELGLGTATTTPVGSDGHYTFRFDAVPLELGTNVLVVTAQTANGRVSVQTVVVRDAVAPPPAPPVIAVTGGTGDRYLATDVIPIAGTVTSTRCTSSVTVNGAAATLVGSGTSASFDTSVSPLRFSTSGTNPLLVTIVATDCDGLSSTVRLTAHHDDGPPVLAFDGAQVSPFVNGTSSTPYHLRGTVQETDLAGVLVDGLPAGLLPTGSPDTYTFDVPVALVRAQTRTITVDAWDHAGQHTVRDVLVRLEVALQIAIATPTNGDRIVLAEGSGALAVEATCTTLASTDVVVASIDGGATLPLTNQGGLLTGVFPDVAAGSHTLFVEARTAEGIALGSATSHFELVDGRTIPLAALRTNPSNGATLVEPNQYVEVQLNKPVDPTKLELRVLETAQGRQYAQGTTASGMPSSGIAYVDVSRSLEPVPGNPTNLPGNQLFVFHPGRDYAYGGTIQVEVVYDGTTVARSQFQVRPLPNLVTGFVSNEDLDPVSGVVVSLPELGLTTTTNADGAFDFGWGEPAARNLPPGAYRLLVNPSRRNADYGTVERVVIVQDGEVARVGVVPLLRVDASEPSTQLTSRTASQSLAGGDVVLDLSGATLIFPSGESSGVAQAQLVDRPRIGYPSPVVYAPEWAYALTPGGIRASGTVSVTFRLPALQGSYAYVASLPEYGYLLGLDPATLTLRLVGIVRIDKVARTATTVRPAAFSRLDYLGFAVAKTEHQPLLARYASGEISLSDLDRALGGQQ